MVRDPSSADPNAQAPVGHPDAQVRQDTTERLYGVQQPVYPNPDSLIEGQPVDPAPVDAAPSAVLAVGPETPDQAAERQAAEAAHAAELAANAANADAPVDAGKGESTLLHRIEEAVIHGVEHVLHPHQAEAGPAPTADAPDAPRADQN